MGIDNIYNGFLYLKGGYLVSLHWEENDLGMKIEFPDMAAHHSPEFRNFFVTLKSCHKFYLQPASGSTVVIDDLNEILALELRLDEPRKTFAGQVKIYCLLGSSKNSGGILSMLADDIRVYDENFDPLSTDDLRKLRRKFVTMHKKRI